MALFTCNFRSAALQIHTQIHVILPEEGSWETGLPDRRWPVLWLLHGLSDDHTIWLRRTAIERYVQGLPLAVVMPAVNRSFYQDMACGARYWSYVSAELPALVRSWFPISDCREENFVAGLSMGGYGALRHALAHPDRYVAAATFSGALAPAATEGDTTWASELQMMFGDPAAVAGSDSDLYALAERVARAGQPRPLIYQYCGAQDFLYAQNLKFRAHLEALGWEFTYTEDDGAHTWDRWDDQVERFLGWLQEKGLLTANAPA